MIGYLTGKVYAKNIDSVILLVGGVGYLVHLPSSQLYKLTINSNAEYYIYTLVKEESLELFGFSTQEDLSLYKTLLNISGIGAKTALNIIDKGAGPVKQAVMNANVDFFETIPRLGRKNAQRIIIELKNKIGAINELDLSSQSDDLKQIIEALQNMGYSRAEVTKAIRALPPEAVSIEEKIRFALKNLGK